MIFRRVYLDWMGSLVPGLTYSVPQASCREFTASTTFPITRCFFPAPMSLLASSMLDVLPRENHIYDTRFSALKAQLHIDGHLWRRFERNLIELWRTNFGKINLLPSKNTNQERVETNDVKIWLFGGEIAVPLFQFGAKYSTPSGRFPGSWRCARNFLKRQNASSLWRLFIFNESFWLLWNSRSTEQKPCKNNIWQIYTTLHLCMCVRACGAVMSCCEGRTGLPFQALLLTSLCCCFIKTSLDLAVNQLHIILIKPSSIECEKVCVCVFVCDSNNLPYTVPYLIICLKGFVYYG